MPEETATSIAETIVENRPKIIKKTVLIGLGVIAGTILVGALIKKRPVEFESVETPQLDVSEVAESVTQP